MRKNTDKFKDMATEEQIPHAKKKALDMLLLHDRSSYELKSGLIKYGFSEEAAEAAYEYVCSFHYIDDQRYAGNIIRSKKDTKSRREIENILRTKHIPDDAVENAMEEFYGEDSEDSAIEEFLRKKHVSDISEIEYEERRKLAAKLYRKGFAAENIRKKLDL